MQVADYLETIASRVRRERLARNLPQREVARRIDLSLRAYQTFEASGHISLGGLVKILFVFAKQNEVLNLLPEGNPTYRSLEDFEQKHRPTRQRARQKKTS